MGTTANGYPYPEDTAALAQGAQAIKSLATAVDSRARASAAGRGTVVVNKAASGVLAVKFPSGRFTVAPSVTATCDGASTYIASVGTVTKDGFNLTVRHYQGTVSATVVNVVTDWQAMTVG